MGKNTTVGTPRSPWMTSWMSTYPPIVCCTARHEDRPHYSVTPVRRLLTIFFLPCEVIQTIVMLPRRPTRISGKFPTSQQWLLLKRYGETAQPRRVTEASRTCCVPDLGPVRCSCSHYASHAQSFSLSCPFQAAQGRRVCTSHYLRH